MLRSLKKAESLARTVKEQIEMRISQVAAFNQVKELRDANGWPMLSVNLDGDVAVGDAHILIRFKSVPGSSPDIFGNETFAYTPHIVELGFETGVVEIESFAPVFAEIVNLKTRIQLKKSINTAVMDEAALNSLAAFADLDDMLWPTKGA